MTHLLTMLLLAQLPGNPVNPGTGQPLPAQLVVHFGATVYPDQSLERQIVPLQWYSDVRWAFELNGYPAGIGLCRTGPGWVAVMPGGGTIVTMSELSTGVFVLQVATRTDCRTALSQTGGPAGMRWANAVLAGGATAKTGKR